MIAGNQGNMGADLHVDDGRFLVHSTDFVSLAYEFRGSGRKPFIRTLVGPSGRSFARPWWRRTGSARRTISKPPAGARNGATRVAVCS